MIRWFVLPALTLLLGGMVAANLSDDPGYVLVQIAGYSMESSLAGLILLAAISLALILLVYRLLVGSVRLPVRIGNMLQERRLNLARAQLPRGLTALAAGEWQKAEAELLKRIADSDEPATHYLYAAEAAHHQQQGERRDEYLQLAAQATPESSQAAVQLKQAQLWAADGRNREAINTLERLLLEQPRHAAAQTLRLNLLAKEQDWDTLRQSFPGARNVVPAEELEALALKTHRALLSRARSSGRLELLRSAWQDVGRTLQHDPGLLAHYAVLCHEMNADADAIRPIVGELRHHWHADLALIYGSLDGGDVVRQLAKVEQWINQHGEKPELLLVAGRLCLRNRLWGRARSYFEACLRSYPSPEIRLELGNLLLQQGEDEKAALELFREGLETSLKPARQPTQELLPASDAPQPLEAPR